MRARVVVIAVLSVLVAGALVASYFLERVEAPKSTYEPPAPIAVAAPMQVTSRMAEPTVVTTDAGPTVAEAARAPAPPRIERRDVSFLTPQRSERMHTACQDAVDSCAARYPPWFPSSMGTELDLERVGEGSRIVNAHFDVKRQNGPPAFSQCMSDALRGFALTDLKIDAEQEMVRCMPRIPKTTVFPSAAKLRDELARCVPQRREDEVSVTFSIENNNGILTTSAMKFEGLGDADVYARRCLELALEAKVAVSPGEVPSQLPRVTLSVKDGGRKISNSLSYGAPISR